MSNRLLFLIIVGLSLVKAQLQYLLVTADNNNFDLNNILKLPPKSPKIHEYNIKTNVSNRYAITVVESKVENTDIIPNEITFSVTIPKRAFISGFIMDIGGKSYKAYIVDAQQAQSSYKQLTSSKKAAGLVKVSTRHSHRFTITVNAEPKSNLTFHLHYEELLERVNGQYEIISNVQPGQFVENLTVEVIINESEKLFFVRTVDLRPATGANIVIPNVDLNPNAKIQTKQTTSRIIFKPSIQRQIRYVCSGLGSDEYDGFAAQFIVNYDIERTNQGGELLVEDDYFVSFFAPINLEPLNKHIVFVLDTSGSMSGTKIEQLKNAMYTIVDQLQENDLFNLVEFSTYSYLWNLDTEDVQTVSLSNYGHFADNLDNMNVANAYQATTMYKEKAKKIIRTKFHDRSSTNIISGLELGLWLVSKVQKQHVNLYQSYIVFLTDGLPNAGIFKGEDIDQLVSKLNKNNFNVPIYALSFGEDADKYFLGNLSVHNNGKHEHIYEGSDAIQELLDFYDKIKTPLLSNITFSNLPQTNQTSQTNFPIFFNGSEISVVGIGLKNTNLTITAKGKSGLLNLSPKQNIPKVKLQRLWAYKTVTQLILERDSTGDQVKKDALTKVARALARHYGFVTPVTQLAVVKPKETGTINVDDAFSGNSVPASTLIGQLCTNLPSWVTEEVTTTEEPTTTELVTTTTEEVTAITEKPTTTTIEPQTTTTEEFTITTELPMTTTEILTTTKQSKTCSETVYGCCPDNVNEAKGPNFKGCEPKHSTNDCMLPKDIGPCSDYEIKWFYNTTYGGCGQFWYGGCDGNTNRFSSKELCINTCVKASPLERCNLPKVQGSCKDNLVKYYFDINTQSCTKFHYSGCLGNNNRFETKKSCSDACEPDIPLAQKRCYLPKKSGSKICNKNQLSYYFNRISGACEQFYYSGCKGNRNRFISLRKCRETCIQPNGKAKCFLPKDSGPCKQFQKYYYYDVNRLECLEFDYGGCLGNYNRFVMKNQCEQLCLQQKQFSSPQDVCYLIRKHGEGEDDNATLKWAFSSEYGECTQFWYKGLKGNENRFNRKEDCERICVNPPNKERCNLPPAKGRCSGKEQKFYYNKARKYCEQFIYGGCGGNANKFDTYDDCMNFCAPQSF